MLQPWRSQWSLFAEEDLGKSEHSNKTVNVARGETSQKLVWTWKQMEELMGAWSSAMHGFIQQPMKKKKPIGPIKRGFYALWEKRSIKKRPDLNFRLLVQSALWTFLQLMSLAFLKHIYIYTGQSHFHKQISFRELFVSQDAWLSLNRQQLRFIEQAPHQALIVRPSWSCLVLYFLDSCLVLKS